MKNKNMPFSFSFVTKETILNELFKLNPKKACQECDILVRIIKENLDIVSNFVCSNFKNYLFSSNFDCILHDLLIAKFAAYGFDYNSLQMLQSYL